VRREEEEGEGREREREEHGLGSRMFWTQTMLYCDQKHALQCKGVWA